MFIWLLALVFAIFPLFGWNRYVSEVWFYWFCVWWNSIPNKIILFFILSLDLHIPYFSFQSYFMGCSFDSFSNSWLDKSYILTLMVLCWLAPTTMNLVCYVAILSRVRASDFEISRVTRRLNSCHSRFHYRNKVKHIDTHFLYFQEINFRP